METINGVTYTKLEVQLLRETVAARIAAVRSNRLLDVHERERLARDYETVLGKLTVTARAA